MVIKKSIDIGGKTLTMETGRFAKQAGGAVMITFGETMVLSTAVAADTPREGIDFFPLTVEYREKIAAAGKIPGGFFKREGKPSEKEVLSARLIDRPIRPMFPDGFRCETQIVATVYSSDSENDADVLGATAASTALMISDVPFDGPIAEVRVGRVEGEWILNPTYTQLKSADIEVVVAGTEDSILMVEGEAKEISEREMLDAIRLAHGEIRKLCALQKEFVAECGLPKREVVPPSYAEGLEEAVTNLCREKITAVVNTVMSKDERSAANHAIVDEVQAALAEQFPEQDEAVGKIIHDIEKAAMRSMILERGVRLDGRGPADIRPISCEVGLLPRSHGSALFTWGETQSLTSVTLGTKTDEQIIDGLFEETTKRFMLHYNFPPFSVGEVGRFGFTGRREIGHGNLAERALKNVAPTEEEFPYTLRIVSDILESNGSSSMATVCAGSLALFDAGVPMSKAVAGIAMGLVKEGETTVILSDILGNEDHLGDMDFKVAGTAEGITSYQMDIKIKGISFEIMETALRQAKEGRLHILGIMNQAIAEPRPEISKYAPHLTTIMIPIDMIGAVIGPGGKMIKHIVAESGAEINIEDDGRVIVAAVDHAASEKAIQMISAIVAVPEEGEIYTGPIKRITDFGAFVEILPGKEGLLHISQIEHRHLKTVDEVLKLGEIVTVKLLKLEDNGKMVLSRKALMERPEGMPEEEERPRREGGGHHRREHEGGKREGGHRDHGHRGGRRPPNSE